jgi:hypothetical protein
MTLLILLSTYLRLTPLEFSLLHNWLSSFLFLAVSLLGLRAQRTLTLAVCLFMLVSRALTGTCSIYSVLDLALAVTCLSH